MLSAFTLIYVYTKASHTLKKWDFSSTLDRANHSVSAFFFCVVRAWRTCSVRRKIKYWSKFFGLSFKYLRDFSCGSHIMRQKYIQISFLSFTLTRHSQSIIKNQYLHYLIFFCYYISVHRKFSEILSQTFVDPENCILRVI